MNMLSFLMVFLGGGIGSAFRYGLGMIFLQQLKPYFPWSTLMVNVLGCFLLGLLVGLTDSNRGMNRELTLLFTTGFCGGFTTFSTFAQESNILAGESEWGLLAGYLSASLFLGLLSNWLGMKLGTSS